MSTPNNDLLERTRIACLERTRRVRQALESTHHGTEPSYAASLRELHAIKGDAVMGGFTSISKLAHTLETLLLHRRQIEPLYLDDACEALRVLAGLLSSTPASELNGLADIDDLTLEVEAAAEAARVESAEQSDAAVQRRDPRRVPAACEQAVATAASNSASGAVQPVDGQASHRPPSSLSPVSMQPAGQRRAEHWLRIKAASVEELSKLVSEIAAELDRARNLAGEHKDSPALLLDLRERLDALRSRLGHMEERAWSLRLVPIASPLQELAEHAEGLARRLGKQVRCEVDAGNVALERGVVETLREPLLHLVRNAVDHGVEAPDARGEKPSVARVRLSAESLGSEVVLAVEDDGAGLDPKWLARRAVELGLVETERAARLGPQEALELIFRPGFSQRREADEVSGRGLGLSAVRNCLEAMGGAVRVAAKVGQGARFELVLPAAVARERVLIAECAGICWAIPARWVKLVVREPDLLVGARREGTLRTREGLVVARPLSLWLGAVEETTRAALVVEIAGRCAALLVTNIVSEVDLLRTPADKLLFEAARVAASGILADGRVALFPRWAEVLREIVQLTDKGSVGEPQHKARIPRVLVADDSPIIRDIVGEVLTSAGIDVKTAPDGKQALALVERSQFDLIVSDIEMPLMNGLELLQAIRKRSAVLPVVMLTTRSKPEHRREAALLGANAYIAKSEFHGDTLLQVVRRFVDLPL